jgi:hypothetical protein
VTRRRPRLASWALFAALLASAPAGSGALAVARGDDPPKPGGFPDPPGKPDVPAPDAPKPDGGAPGPKDAPPKPKEPPPDPRKLPDEEKAKRLAEIEKKYEDLRRNQDLVPVRTRRNDTTFAGDLRWAPAARFLKKVFDDDRDTTTNVAALIAIGKCGDFDTIEYAVKKSISVAKKQPVFVANLPRMFAQVESTQAKEWLPSRLEGIAQDDVLAWVVAAVGETGLEAAMPELRKVMDRSSDPAVRFEVLRAYGRCGKRTAFARLIPFLSDPDWRLRMAAVEGLGFTADPAAIADVRRLIVRAEEPIVVETAVEAVARLGTKDAFEPLIESLKVGRLRARQKARAALRRLSRELWGHEKDYHVDPNAWALYWRKVSSGMSPDDPSFSKSETTSYFRFPVVSDRVLFILDVSGSMNWPDAPRESDIKPSDWKDRRIDAAHKELFRVLRDLAKQNRGRIPKGAKKGDTDPVPWSPTDEGVEPPTLFNVATFAGVVTPWQKEAVLANDVNVELAVAWLEKQLPRGGTATYDALEFGISQNHIDTVFFLSDGVPSLGRIEEREAILAEVRRLNRFKRVTIHTVALIIGLSPIESARKYEDPSDMADLMKRIADENQGEFADESRQ